MVKTKKKSKQRRYITKIKPMYYRQMSEEEDRKTSDLRQFGKTSAKLQVGDVMLLKIKDSNDPILPRLITKKTWYPNLRSFYDNDHHLKCVFPRLHRPTFEDIKSIYYGFGYSRKITTTKGVFVFDLEPEHQTSSSRSNPPCSKTPVVPVDPSADEGDEGPGLVVVGGKRKRKRPESVRGKSSSKKSHQKPSQKRKKKKKSKKRKGGFTVS